MQQMSMGKWGYSSTQLNVITVWSGMVSLLTWPLYTQEESVGGCVDLRTSLNVFLEEKISCLCKNSNHYLMTIRRSTR